MNWHGCKVAVTGAGGFIGSHLTERLLAEGAQVRALVRDGKPGHLDGIEHPNLERCSIELRDSGSVAGGIAGMEVVFHLGAVTSVAYSYEHPEETVQTNVLGTLNVCTAAREAGLRRLVHTSTAGVYGDAQDGKPISEEHPVHGCNPYTAGKLGGDFVAETFHLSYGLPVATVRLFNVFGPRMGRYLIMPTIIEQLLRGPELTLGDLSPTRTFTYIDDIVDGYLLAAASDGALGKVVHFGAERVITMRELVDLVAKQMGTQYSLVQDPSRMRPPSSEIYRVVVDSSRARNLLGWDTTVGLEQGIERTIAWFKERHHKSTVNC